MKTSHSRGLLLFAIVFLVAACDENGIVGHVAETQNERTVQMIRIDLTDPEESLSGMFHHVFSGEKTVWDIGGLWTVVLTHEGITEEFEMPTEGVTLSRMTNSSFILTLHGISATQAATAKAGKDFCKMFGSSEIDDVRIDEWVQNGQSRIDKTFRLPLEFQGKRIVVNFLKSFYDKNVPYRLYIDIYFDSKE